MGRLVYLLLVGLFAASQSVLGQEIKTSDVSSVSIQDFEGAVYELENNYAGFPILEDDPIRLKEYSVLKTKLYNKVKKGKIEGYDAVGELYGWFGDSHLRTGLAEHHKYRKMRKEYVSFSEGMNEYNPIPVAKKVSQETFLIRFTSCSGDPSLEWIYESIEAYKESHCKYLIIDIRGNSGGQDSFYKPYLKLLYDTEYVSKGVELRNSVDNINYLKTQVERLPWLQDIIANAENSSEAFIGLVDDFTIKYDTISPYPVKAAIIIDSNVASSAEQMVLDVKGCSQRTTVYGKGNTLGCLDYSNIRRADLKRSKITTWIPMTRSCRLPENGIDKTGIAPDVRISIEMPKKLTDNIDEWVLRVTELMEKEQDRL